MSSSFLISLVIFLFPIMQILEAHERSTTRRQLGPESCRTGNPIDDCWRCDSEWESNRKALADCAVGFGRNAVGGRDGEIYIVKSKDDDPVDPIPGSLRYAVIQEEPLWIIFDHDMVINLKQELVMNSYKTIDGRGFNVQMSNGPCISIYNVSNIIIHNIYIHDCVPAGSAVVRDSPKHYGPRGRSDGDGISIFGSRDIWIDHCTFSHCYDGLIDIVYGSTAITISDGDGISIFGSRDIWIDHCTFSHCYDGLIDIVYGSTAITISDGDGISIFGSRDIWIDHCTFSHCYDGLIDIVYGSTAITISNNYMFHHNEVMLMGHSDDFSADKNMQVTIAFNFFGDGLVQRMPRCRHGFFHIVNNIYTGWEMYAIGGSANPTINSQGNVFIASNDESTKEVTKHEIISEDDEWKKWNWRSEGDLMLNGAFFTPSGQETPASYMKASSMVARPATSLLTASSPSAGALSCRNSQPC